MRKEVSIAIIIGIILGGVILYGIKIANDSTNNLSGPTPTPTSAILTTPTPTGSENNNPKISITSHSSGQVLFEKDITIVGKTLPNKNISIIWEDDESVFMTNDLGEFSQKLSLTSGENNIQIDVVDQNKQLVSQTLKLYYSTKPINQ